jgi:predicted RNA-binding Zn ribbon-like protein
MVMNDETEHQPVESFDLIGGALCLDFVNTGSARREGPFRERLHAYGDLVSWAERVELVTESEAADLRQRAAAEPARAAAVVKRARELREAIYRAFSARVQGAAGEYPDIDLIGRAYAEASAQRMLVDSGDGFELAWPKPPVALEHPLWPVAVSAAELLVSDDRVRVKECATDNCNWLFLDSSKNRSRRWCEMKECGNRAKARRHYARKRRVTSDE